MCKTRKGITGLGNLCGFGCLSEAEVLLMLDGFLRMTPSSVDEF